MIAGGVLVSMCGVVWARVKKNWRLGSEVELSKVEPLKRACVVVTPFSLQQREEKLIRVRCLIISRA